MTVVVSDVLMSRGLDSVVRADKQTQIVELVAPVQAMTVVVSNIFVPWASDSEVRCRLWSFGVQLMKMTVVVYNVLMHWGLDLVVRHRLWSLATSRASICSLTVAAYHLQPPTCRWNAKLEVAPRAPLQRPHAYIVSRSPIPETGAHSVLRTQNTTLYVDIHTRSSYATSINIQLPGCM